MRLTVSRNPEQLVSSARFLSILRLASKMLLSLFVAAAILHFSSQALALISGENRIAFIDAIVAEDIKIEQKQWY
jgi:hypothetical protein